MKKLLLIALSLLLLAGCDKASPEEISETGTAGTTVSAESVQQESAGSAELPENAGTGSEETPAPADEPEETSLVRRMTDADRPIIVETVHPTSAPVIADIIATDPEFGADPTGEEDSTMAIRKAVRECFDMGGGTVYLPAGTYKLTDQIEVPAFVTLRGDWIDPDTVEDPAAIENYGTVILSYQKSSSRTDDALFNIRGSAGVMGLTVYYPEQDIDNVKPYPFTFYTTGNGIGGYMLASVQDCTVLNGYAGIGACVSEDNAHEMLTVDNVKGTFLSVGAEAYNQADVGTWKSVTVSPSYWANASAGLEAAPYDKVAAYMKENTVGMKLGDLEWTQLADIEIESCATGIAAVKGKRITFAGTMIDVNVSDCVIGLDVQDLDARWGMVIARSSFEGSDMAMCNSTRGTVKLTDVELLGSVGGSGKIMTADEDLSGYAVDYSRTYTAPEAILYTASIPDDENTDVSDLLQQALDEVGKTGGILYLTPGYYRVDSPVTVPSGVELRGASSVPTRDQGGCSKGTLIVTTYGLGAENAAEMPALITLGENSGVSGMRFYYFTNNPATCGETPYVIRGTGSGVYAVNCSIVAAGYGIDFTGCDNHYIKKFVGGCYYNALRAGGKNGLIEGCLQNGNTFTRSGLDFLENWIEESTIFEDLFPKLRRYSTFLLLDGAENETVFNFFAYGVAAVVKIRNSSDVLFCNIGGDNIGVKDALLISEKSSAAVVNMMRYNGRSVKEDGESSLALYNRITIDEANEKNIVNGEERDYVSAAD